MWLRIDSYDGFNLVDGTGLEDPFVDYAIMHGYKSIIISDYNTVNNDIYTLFVIDPDE